MFPPALPVQSANILFSFLYFRFSISDVYTPLPGQSSSYFILFLIVMFSYFVFGYCVWISISAHAPAQIMCQFKNIASMAQPGTDVKPRGFGTKKDEKKVRFIKYSSRFVKENFADKFKIIPG